MLLHWTCLPAHFATVCLLQYPNAKTHLSHRVRGKTTDGKSIFEKGKTKERRPFSHAEDEALKRGYDLVSSWSPSCCAGIFGAYSRFINAPQSLILPTAHLARFALGPHFERSHLRWAQTVDRPARPVPQRLSLRIRESWVQATSGQDEEGAQAK